MPPRGTIADAKDFAQRRRLDRYAPRPLPKAAPFLPGTLVPLRGAAGSCIAPAAARCGQMRDSGGRSASPEG
jgi:hypothetical protein